MKKIVKQNPPNAFLSWRNMGNADWMPTWSGLAGTPKIELHTALIKEQGFICCYCGVKINLKDSHIEHLVPQSKNTSLSLEYGNLLASCQRNISKNEPRHCGVLKGDWYDQLLMVSPFDDDCEQRFAFNAFGNISCRNKK